MGKLLGAFIPSISDSKGTGILDDLGKDQHLQQHPARQFREPDERMMGSFDLSGSAAKFADAEIDSVAIWMSRGCEPGSVLGFFPQSSDTLAFFWRSGPSLGQRSTTFWGRSHSIMARWHEVLRLCQKSHTSYALRCKCHSSSCATSPKL